MRFSALGDSAIVAGCGEGISRQTLQWVRQFASAVERAKIAGVVDVVPAFASVTVFYVPGEVESGAEGAYAKILGQLKEIAAGLPPAPPSTEGRTVEIPVCYGGEFGPDLEAVARIAKLSSEEVVRGHREQEYLVHAIGFAPGFPYLGGLAEALHAPRLATPRVRVEAGSVGIGGAQTGIYPLATPGGWQLIGRTSLELFDVARAKPSLLSVGDTVKFREIAAADFRAAGAKEKAEAPSGSSDVAPGLRVHRAGALTTVQDRGRVGHRAEGVALGGAADPVALRVANWLVGNDANAPALEFTLVGPELEFLTDAVVALGGATFGDFPSWQPVTVRAGTRIRFGAARGGCRGYLAVAGGFEIPRVLGSASTALRAGFGGFHGRALREGDALAWRPKSLRIPAGWRIDERALPPYNPAPTVRVIRGAQADDFFEQLFSSEFTVSARADRMGLRLAGPAMRSREAKELISTAVAPGTIQIPADGQPIVLLCDAQTIGGYPQAAHVITVDLPIVAQLRPGDRLRFREVSLEDAQKFLVTREHVLAMLHEGISQKLG